MTHHFVYRGIGEDIIEMETDEIIGRHLKKSGHRYKIDVITMPVIGDASGLKTVTMMAVNGRAVASVYRFPSPLSFGSEVLSGLFNVYISDMDKDGDIHVSDIEEDKIENK